MSNFDPWQEREREKSIISPIVARYSPNVPVDFDERPLLSWINSEGIEDEPNGRAGNRCSNCFVERLITRAIDPEIHATGERLARRI